MEEVINALAAFKDTLTCSCCKNLVRDEGLTFVKCSHLVCSEHVTTGKFKACPVCNNSKPGDVIKSDVREMIINYKALQEIFNNSEITTSKNPAKIQKKNSVKSSKDLSKPGHKEKNIVKIDEKSVTSKRMTKSNINITLKEAVVKPAMNARPSRNAAKSSPQKDTGKCNLRNSSKSPQESNIIKSKSLSLSPKKVTKTTTRNSAPESKTVPKTVEVTPKKDLRNTPRDSVSEVSFNTVKKNAAKRNKKGETPLHAACVKGALELVKNLLIAGANPNTKDNAGWTPLHEAVGAGRTELVQALLENGALPSPPGPHYTTPLHEAVRSRYPEVVKLLLNGGADVSARDNKGLTPLDVADEDMKSILTKIKPSTHKISATPIEINTVIRIYPSNLAKESAGILQKLAKSHDDLKIESEFSKNVTHILVEDNSVNRDTLLAIVSGRIILSRTWLQRCNSGELANTLEYEVSSLRDSQQCIRLSKINQDHLRPRLFDGCHFYFVGFTSAYEISAHLSVTKAFLCQLVAEGGGVVLKREPNPEGIPESERLVPYHAPSSGALAHCAHYIIYQNAPQLTYNMSHLKSLPVGWLINCIEKFQLINP